MPRTYNRWILTKSCEFAPDGNLCLGQILAKPKDPAHVLQPLGPLSLHDGIVPEITSRSNVSIHDGNELSAQFRTWAGLGYLPAQFEVASTREHFTDCDWHFDKLESRIMSPDLAYVTSAMRHGDVESSLRNWRNPFKRRVYMVTGVRVVSGASLRRRKAVSTDHAATAAGATPDMSMSTGIHVNFAATSTESEGFEEATDFVFAYRLNEVRYRGTVSHRPYVRGETSSAGEGCNRRGEIKISDFEVLGLSDFDLLDEEDEFDCVFISDDAKMETFVGKVTEDDDD